MINFALSNLKCLNNFATKEKKRSTTTNSPFILAYFTHWPRVSIYVCVYFGSFFIFFIHRVWMNQNWSAKQICLVYTINLTPRRKNWNISLVIYGSNNNNNSKNDGKMKIRKLKHEMCQISADFSPYALLHGGLSKVNIL